MRVATFAVAVISASSVTLKSYLDQHGRAPALTSDKARAVGKTASLNEDGYLEVVAANLAAKSGEEMTHFVDRLCRREGLHINNKVAYGAFEKYFDGECASQNFEALVAGLHTASSKPAACGGGWISRLYKPEAASSNGHISLLSSTVSEQTNDIVATVLRSVRAAVGPGPVTLDEGLVKANGTQAMEIVISGVVSAFGGEITDPERLSQFASEFYTHLEQRLQKQGAHPGSWLKIPSSDRYLAELVQNATFDEVGYETVARLNDDDKMLKYMQRICRNEGWEVKEGVLRGMTPYYTAACGLRSYQTLQNELDLKAHPEAPEEDETESAELEEKDTNADEGPEEEEAESAKLEEEDTNAVSEEKSTKADSRRKEGATKRPRPSCNWGAKE